MCAPLKHPREIFHADNEKIGGSGSPWQTPHFPLKNPNKSPFIETK